MKGYRQQAGLGLIELSLVIAIIAGVTVSVLYYFTIAAREARINTTITQIRDVANASYVWLRSNPNFSGLSVKKLTDDKYLDASYRDGTKVTPWDGDIVIVSVNSNNNIRLSITNIPDAITCDSLKAKFIKKNSTAGCWAAGATKTFTITY